jgi:proteasome beta subunit
MSVDGKVRALSKLLRDNFGFVVQGIGVVVPIFATFDFAGKGAAADFISTTRWGRNLK